MSRHFKHFIEDDSVLTVELYESFTKTEKKQIRDWILRDVWFAAQKVFRDSTNLPLQPCHRDACYGLVQPNPDLPLHAWDATKERCIICFRGFGKTTLDIGHCVQIILSAPDCRLLFVGGTVQHAERKMWAVVDIFNTNAIIQHLFPNFYNASVRAGTFTCPARTNTSLKEATITCASFRSTNASGHYDWLKLDDAQNDANSGTAAAVEKSMVKFDDLSPLLEPNGYTDFVGVRQDANDIPAQMAERSHQMGSPLGWVEIPVFTLKDTGDETLNAQVMQRYVQNKLDLDRDVDFAWPQRWNAQTLRLPYSKPNFNENYLLEVTQIEIEETIPPVTPELLNTCLTNDLVDYLTCCPVLNGDLATVGKSGSDACCVVGGYWNPDAKNLTVTGIILKKFVEREEFIKSIWSLYDAYRHQNGIHFRIEQANQARELWDAEFKSVQVFADFQLSASQRWERVERLFAAIRAGKLRFDASLQLSPAWKDLVFQCCNFGKQELPHDDVVDSLAQLWEYVQGITSAEPAPFHTRNAREIAVFGQELGGDTFDGVHSVPMDSPQHDETYWADVDFLKRFTVR